MRKVGITPTSVHSNNKLSIQSPLEVETATRRIPANGDLGRGRTKPSSRSSWNVGEEVVVVPFSPYHYPKHQGLSIIFSIIVKDADMFHSPHTTKHKPRLPSLHQIVILMSM